MGGTNSTVSIGQSAGLAQAWPERGAGEQLILLRDASPGDASADEHKRWAESMAGALQAAGLKAPAARVRDCASALFYDLVADQTTGEIRHRLRSAPYCRYRHCPVCQWRRSLRNRGMLMSNLPRIWDRYPTARFALLTLTVRNCPVSDLRATANAMARGWQRLIKRTDWPARGWLRAFEVTRGKDDSAHPHYHVLLMVPSVYFGRAYVPTREWVRRWREVMRLDYDPVCDIRAIKAHPARIAALEAEARASGVPLAPSAIQRAALVSGVAEVAKYSTKALDLLRADPGWLAAYVQQVHGLKIITSGGVLKGALQDMREDEGEDLVHVGNGEIEGEVEGKVAYHWRTKLQHYARKRQA